MMSGATKQPSPPPRSRCMWHQTDGDGGDHCANPEGAALLACVVVAPDGSDIIPANVHLSDIRRHAEALIAERDAATARADALAAELGAAKERAEHREEWYGTRFERLRAWANALPDERRVEYFSIIANGTADVHEPPTYAQQMNLLRFRAEAAEADRDAWKERAELRAWWIRMNANHTEWCGYTDFGPDADGSRSEECTCGLAAALAGEPEVPR